jgi:hypothetical protein
MMVDVSHKNPGINGNPAPAVIKRPPWIIVIAVMHILLGIGGVPAGIGFIADPSGKNVGVPKSLLDHLPIHDFLIPGLVLLIILGLLPLITAAGLLKKEFLSFLQKLNILKAFGWAYTCSLFVGCFLIGWTSGELILWGINFLSVLYLGWGMITLVLCFIPGVRRYYRSTTNVY